jgi:hypothetical protein
MAPARFSPNRDEPHRIASPERIEKGDIVNGGDAEDGADIQDHQEFGDKVAHSVRHRAILLIRAGNSSIKCITILSKRG